jgi:hypothetical protein
MSADLEVHESSTLTQRASTHATKVFASRDKLMTHYETLPNFFATGVAETPARPA